jgi:putative oxidoreductase
MMKIIPEKWLGKNKDFGLLVLRLFIGIRLIYGVADNVFSRQHMVAFEQFLAAHNFPFPLISAIVSVYAQLFTGLMIILGFHVRIAALILVLNFLIAIFTVHFHDSFEAMTPALSMLFCNLLFLFTGPGKYSVRREI